MGVVDGFIIFTTGFLGGLASSAPIGPINLWYLQSVLSQNKTAAFLSGVILCDLGYAILAGLGYRKIEIPAPMEQFLGIAAGIVLIGMGLKLLKYHIHNNEGWWRDKNPETSVNPVIKRRYSGFWLGFFLTGSNPAFLAFWVFIWDLLEKKQHVFEYEGWIVLSLFGVGVIMGDLLWFGGLRQAIKRGVRNFGSGFVKVAHKIIAIFLLLAGLGAIIMSV